MLIPVTATFALPTLRVRSAHGAVARVDGGALVLEHAEVSPALRLALVLRSPPRLVTRGRLALVLEPDGLHVTLTGEPDPLENLAVLVQDHATDLDAAEEPAARDQTIAAFVDACVGFQVRARAAELLRLASRKRHRVAPIDPKAFYAPVQLAVPDAKRRRASLPPIAQFRTQRDAIARCAELSGACHVFSEDLDATGKRQFLVAAYRQLWEDRIDRQLPHERHYYEVIQDGVACHMYFDIEFSTALNPGRDGAAAMDAFYRLLAPRIQVAFGIDFDRTMVLDLDSSTEAKFSRHLVVHLPHACFADNATVGRFVQDWVHEIEAEPERHAALLVCGSSGRQVPILDPGVYTRNRNFRTYLSCKYGRSACLVQAPTNVFPSDSAWHTFQASLVCNIQVDDTERILTYESRFGLGNTYRRSGTAARAEAGPHAQPIAAPRSDATEGYGDRASPFPRIDDFVRDLVNSDPPHAGTIRSWTYFPASQNIVYTIGGDYRYCHKVQRHHRSNSIMLVVKLATLTFYQKCLDFDCRGFRSSEFAIPVEYQAAPDVTDADLASAMELLEEEDRMLHAAMARVEQGQGQGQAR